MTDVFLVRHGETLWHDENRYAGQSDVELSHRGREQAQALATWAAEAELDALWCSGLRRSRETAMPCAEASGLEVKADSRLDEIGFGQAEGLTSQEMRRRFPRELDAFHADPIEHPLPGGEDPRVATARGIACLAEITEVFPLGRVLVVTHNSLIRLMLCQLLGIPLAEYRSRFPSIRNCAVNEIHFLAGNHAVLRRFNAPLIEQHALGQEVADCTR